MKQERLMKYFRALQLIFVFSLGISFVDAQGFVGANGTEFEIDGNHFYFSGANNYYLFYKPLSNVQEVMDDAAGLGLKVIRTWGFCDGTCSSGNYYPFQSSPGVYNEATFQRFDRVIKEASDRGLRLTVPLVNNWDEFGGMCQYVRWCNLTNASICDADEPWPFEAPTQAHDLFYSNSCTRQTYKNYISYVLNRNNTLTGILYKNDPTIFAWELANEPRCRSDTSGATLNAWIGEMSAYIKTIDTNHMVTPGSDGGYKDKPSNPTWSWWYHGNEGQDYIANHQWSSVDFATFRYYPESGKFDDVNPQLWILEHIDDAHYLLGKPVIMEEFGSVVNKETVLADYYNQLEMHGVNGDTVWMVVDHLATGNDGYFISCPEDSAVCNVISSHADFMNNMSVECSTDNDCNNLDAGYCDANKVMHDEGRCIAGQCQAETTTIEDCDDGNPGTTDTCLANLTCSHVQQNQGCVVPYDNMLIDQSTTFCRGNYTLLNGINITADNVVLDCNLSILNGNTSVYMIKVDNHSGDTVKNCIIRNSGGMNIAGQDFTVTSNNISGSFNTLGNNTSILDNVALKVISRGSNLLISGNKLNSGQDHVLYLIRVYNSRIVNNNISCVNWGRCISLDGVENNIFENNTIHDGGSAVYCWYSCRNNMFSDNRMLKNVYGMTASSASNYYGNTACRNDFTNNTNDIGSISNITSIWDCSGEGNHWSRHDEPAEGCQDADQNGICDSPYNINASGNIDNFPLTHYPRQQALCTSPYGGMNITQDTVLCQGNYLMSGGLSITSSNVVLDCNGANIQGPGTGIGISAQGVFDIEYWGNKTNNLQNLSVITENVTGFVASIGFIENITIKNCNIQGFDNGMNLTGLKNLELMDNVVHDNNAGIIYGTYYGTIADNIAYNNQNGIVGAGINSTIKDNEVYGSNNGIIVAGIGNSVSGNNAHDNPGTGISIGGFDNIVYNNHASANSGNDGISLVYSVGADVYNNTAEQSGRAGISIIEGSNNTVSGNLMKDNRFGFGMQGLFSQGPSSGNVISGNVIIGSTEAGIALHDGVIWDIAKLLFGSNVKIKGHRVIENNFTANSLNNTVDLYVYGAAVKDNKILGNDFYGGGVTGPGDNIYCVGSVGNNYYNGAQEAPGEC